MARQAPTSRVRAAEQRIPRARWRLRRPRSPRRPPREPTDRRRTALPLEPNDRRRTALPPCDARHPHAQEGQRRGPARQRRRPRRPLSGARPVSALHPQHLLHTSRANPPRTRTLAVAAHRRAMEARRRPAAAPHRPVHAVGAAPGRAPEATVPRRAAAGPGLRTARASAAAAADQI